MLLTADWKAEVTPSTPEISFKHLRLTKHLWNYKHERLWLQRGGICPGNTDSPPGRGSADHITDVCRGTEAAALPAVGFSPC